MSASFECATGLDLTRTGPEDYKSGFLPTEPSSPWYFRGFFGGGEGEGVCESRAFMSFLDPLTLGTQVLCYTKKNYPFPGPGINIVFAVSL